MKDCHLHYKHLTLMDMDRILGKSKHIKGCFWVEATPKCMQLQVNLIILKSINSKIRLSMHQIVKIRKVFNNFYPWNSV